MRSRVLTLFVSVAVGVVAAEAQMPARGTAPTGWEVKGIPALNFNSDEGVGYGIVLQAYNYGPSGATPYRFTIQPTLFLTTRGRRAATVFFDAPHLLRAGWRIGAYVAQEQQLATPYYGIGNGTPHDKAAERAPNLYFYRFGRRGIRVSTDVQRSLTRSARLLVGAGVRTVRIDPTPYDSGTTLLAQTVGAVGVPDGQITWARVGLVWDTRDREVGARHGAWVEALAQRGVRTLGATYDFTRLTFTARGYVSPGARTTLASRLILQNLDGDVPFYELFTVQGSFKDDEGLGGAGTLRGLPKDRFAGKGLAASNSEVRVRAADFALRGQASSLVLNAFLDAGRVWSDRLRLGQLGDALHLGYGAGARLVVGTNFVIALDAGHSSESAAQIYIGLGYLF